MKQRATVPKAAFPSRTRWPPAPVLVLQDVTPPIHMGGGGAVLRTKLRPGGSASAPGAQFPLLQNEPRMPAPVWLSEDGMGGQAEAPVQETIWCEARTGHWFSCSFLLPESSLKAVGSPSIWAGFPLSFPPRPFPKGKQCRCWIPGPGHAPQ